MERDPHLVLEGCLIAAYAIEASVVYIYVRGEYPHSIARIERRHRGGPRGRPRRQGHPRARSSRARSYVHPGAGAYICGEETGLLESLEGKRGHPRIKPPFPAVEGVFRCPTIINNVETLAHVPWIVAHGGEAFAKQGIRARPREPAQPRHRGHEADGRVGPGPDAGRLGVRGGHHAAELVYGYGGGPLPGRKIKAVIPGGLSMPVLLDGELDVKMGFDDLVKVGSGLGTGVRDRDGRLVRHGRGVASTSRTSSRHESCGQCTPCREGCHWLEKILQRDRRRRRAGGRPRPDGEPLQEHRGPHDLRARRRGRLAAAQSILKKFRGEFLAKMAPAPAAAGA